MPVIEFAGPSCAGKSTLIRGLAERLTAKGIPHRPVLARAEQGKSDQIRGLLDPRVALWCLLNLRIVLDLRVRRMIGAIGLARRLRKERGAILIDEGQIKIFHAVASLGPRATRLVWRAMAKPDVLVIVTCDPAERLNRMRAADRPHVRGRSDAEVLGRVPGDVYARAIAGLRRIEVVEVDTSPGRPTPDLFTALGPRLPLRHPGRIVEVAAVEDHGSAQPLADQVEIGPRTTRCSAAPTSPAPRRCSTGSRRSRSSRGS